MVRCKGSEIHRGRNCRGHQLPLALPRCGVREQVSGVQDRDFKELKDVVQEFPWKLCHRSHPPDALIHTAICRVQVRWLVCSIQIQ